ncbi:MAG: hypothetical protein GX964_03340 [Syntrophomonadaceae bacterium]|nr:hypothetical protein [Syntrophomonadaceae bacterium]
MQTIACIFFPCFYTSLARWDRPEWNERPLVVYREGQVIGVSAELKGRALVGMPLPQARGRCPEGHFVAGEGVLYKKAQNRYLQVLTRFSPLIEPWNEEECFFDLTGSRVQEELRKLKIHIAGKEWGPVLVGIARNKFLARLVVQLLGGTDYRGWSDFQVVEVPAGEEKEFLRGLSLEADWLLPPRALARLKRMGFKYFREIQELSLNDLTQMLGDDGYIVYQHSRGQDHTPLVNLYPPGKVAFSLSFAGEVAERETLKRALRKGARVLTSLLRTRRKGCRSLCLRLIMEEKTVQASRLVPWGYRDEGRLREVLGLLLERLWGEGPVAGMVIEASSLYDWTFTEPNLFSPGIKTGGARYDLKAVVEALNQKHPGKVQSGLELDRRERVLAFWDPWRSGEER